MAVFRERSRCLGADTCAASDFKQRATERIVGRIEGREGGGKASHVGGQQRESSLGSVERRSGVGLIAPSPPSPLPSSNEWTDPGTQDVTAILSQLRMSGERWTRERAKSSAPGSFIPVIYTTPRHTWPLPAENCEIDTSFRRSPIFEVEWNFRSRVRVDIQGLRNRELWKGRERGERV